MTAQPEVEVVGDYLDLDLEIDHPTEEGTFSVTVREPGERLTKAEVSIPAALFARGPAGAAPAPDGAGLAVSSARERRVLPPEPDGKRPDHIPAEGELQQIGQALFDAVFSGPVRDAYVRVLSLLEQGTGAPRRLRLRLHLQEGEVAALPWEYLFDRERVGDFLCLHQTSIVRRLAEPRAAVPLRVTPPLRILAMLASPADQAPIQAEDERRWMEEALRELQAQDLAVLQWVGGQTADALADALAADGPGWHVFHFVGHGGFDGTEESGYLALEGQGGGTRRLSMRELGSLLDEQPQLRLVLLNACGGAQGTGQGILASTAAHLVHRHSRVPAVVAMRGAIRDAAATHFARWFYSALAAGLPVDLAVTRARKRVRLACPGTGDWATPVLYLQTAEGALFSVPPASAPIARGLGAVTAWALRAPDVRARAAGLGDVFRRTSEQIDRVVTCKELHDQLDVLDITVFQVLRKAGTTEGARDAVATHLPDLEAVVERAREIVARSRQADPADLRWIDVLADACTTLQGAVDASAAGAFEQALAAALAAIERVLRRHPERLNQRLRAAANDLGLARLAAALVTINTRPAEPAHSSEAQRLDAAIDPLLAFKARLDAFVDEHDRWQELNADLLEMETALAEPDLAGFARSRDYVRPRLAALYDGRAEAWATLLAGAQATLDRALAEAQEAPTGPQATLEQARTLSALEGVKTAFEILRRRARNRFLRVDLDLRHLCEDLGPVGSELSPVLQVIK